MNTFTPAPPYDPEILRKNIMERMHRHGTTVTGLAGMAGVSQGNLSDFFNKKRISLRIEIITALAAEFRCTVGDLLGETPPPATPDTAPPAPIDRPGWADHINASWRASVESIIETGRRLIAAKASLPHGEFEAMVDSDLAFAKNTAHRLRAIAADQRITNVAHAPLLPASWGTLYELTKIEDDTAFAEAVRSGAIHPDMERKHATHLRTGERRLQRLQVAERLATTETPLETVTDAGRRYPVIYADPPWRHETYSEAGKEKAAENHYPTLAIDQIKALPVPLLAAPSCALFLWTTGPHLAQALDLMAHWDFAYRSHLVWRKKWGDWAPARGTGYWFRNTHELLLLGVRGDMPAPVMGSQVDSVIDAPVGRHSEKPEAFRQMIERYFPDVGRIELFRRGPAATGWDAWGNEVTEGE